MVQSNSLNLHSESDNLKLTNQTTMKNVFEKALISLDQFMVKRGIKYCLTGTFALAELGLVVPGQEPKDIDVAVFDLSDDEAQALVELEDLSGMSKTNPSYDNVGCYTFLVNGIKVNAIVYDKEREYAAENKVNISVPDEKDCFRLIPVHAFNRAMELKIKLGREKDLRFVTSLTGALCNLATEAAMEKEAKKQIYDLTKSINHDALCEGTKG